MVYQNLKQRWKGEYGISESEAKVDVEAAYNVANEGISETDWGWA